MIYQDYILYNAIKTPDGTILHSKHRHDYIEYKDKNGERYMVDGGSDYARRSANRQSYKELSIMDNGDHELRRKYLHWGVNFTKDMERLSETIWKPIEELTSDHIEAIIDGNFCRGGIYLETFIDELKYRQNHNNYEKV